MKIIALDDEKIILQNLINCINVAAPEAEIYAFTKGSEVIKFIEKTEVDIAFLDVQLRGNATGIEVANVIFEKWPKTNIIFCTGYDEYGLDAIKVRASGYVQKPVTVDDITEELNNLRYPIESRNSKRIRFQCFGNFEVFVDSKPFAFQNAKTKEMLAYLVDRSGSMASNREIMTVLWEDDKPHNSYFKKIRKELIDKLNELDCLDILEIQHGSLGINVNEVDCDYYDWKNGLLEDTFINEYMAQYPWSIYHTPF